MAYEQNMNQMPWQQQPQMQQNQYQQMPMQTYTYENIPEANIQNWAIAPGSRIVFLNQNEEYYLMCINGSAPLLLIF